MIITCENCNTSFNLDEKLLKPTGSKVRCSRCKHLFIAYPPAPPAEEAPAATEAEEKAPETAAQEEAQQVMAPEMADMEKTVELRAESLEDDEAFSEDLDAALGFDTEEEAPAEGLGAAETVEMSLEEMDLDLDFDQEAEPSLEAAEEPADAADDLSMDLDISDLDETMELEFDAAEPEAVDTATEDLDLDLDFDLGMESDTEEPAEEAEAAVDIEPEELDFSDFEETVMLDSPPMADIESPVEDVTEDLDLDLDLDLEMEEEPEAVEEPEMPAIEVTDGSELEDLDLEMDLEMEGLEAEEAEPTGEETEDVDLSDIEKMLAPETGKALKSEVEKWKQRPEQQDLMDETAEIDLSDIVLDAEEVEEAEAEDIELDLDIDEASEKAAAEAAAAPVKDASDIDISEFEEFEIPEEEEAVEQDFGGGDIELEFELDGETTPVGLKPFDSGGEPETVAFAAPFMDSAEHREEKAEKKKPVKVKSARKSRLTAPLLILLILLILAFAAVIVLDRINIKIPVVTDYVKQLPYVSQLMAPEVVQTGEIRISDISSKFVDNTKHGKFFVIRGTATNDFKESRRYIKITGTLFATGKQVVKENEIYCGNMISDANLAKMTLDDINKSLANRFGDKKSNFEVKPGQAIPFMLVFSDLPDNLEEFAIEVTDSSPVQAQ